MHLVLLVVERNAEVLLDLRLFGRLVSVAHGLLYPVAGQCWLVRLKPWAASTLSQLVEAACYEYAARALDLQLVPIVC